MLYFFSLSNLYKVEKKNVMCLREKVSGLLERKWLFFYLFLWLFLVFLLLDIDKYFMDY